ncbi:MAG: S1C family serine protease [Gaiellaceae bacterium]
MKRPASRFLPVLAALVVATSLGAVAGAAIYAAGSGGSTTVVKQVPVETATPAASTRDLTVSQVYRRTAAGVVEITSTGSGSSSGFPGQSPQQQAQGSGFVYDREGHVVTNQHVVDGADSVSATFSNGESYDARVIGTDASTDLAVLDVDAPAALLSPLPLGDSDKLAVGEGVVALGSPFGLQGTLTAGVVSALHRQMTAPNDFTINDSIQTDAAINHGNSGGPLLNLRGRVVGVNAQIRSDSGGNEGVGFAIPSNTVRSIVRQLLGSGKVEHAFLGVSVQGIPAGAAEELDLPTGVAIAEVRDDGPAQKAGLRAATGNRSVNGTPYPTGGDVITAIDGKAVATAEDLQRAIDARRPGDTVTLTLERAGRTQTLKIELAERPE